ncbi:MAG: hypothetical protein M3209_02075 [Acidobacteriota bacterium]|nr:hypothetical protein [Acidobacteriota bacterium]
MKRTHFLYLVILLTASLVLVESLSVRRAEAATLVVTTTTDNGDNTTPTAGSLRAAIVTANSTGGADTINFNIPASDPNCNATTNVCTIAPPAPLPSITAPVSIDGYTQPGASPNTLANGTNAVLRIELSGASAGAGANGLTLTGGANASVIKGLIINRFSSSGIRLESGNSNSIFGNFIGTDATGTIDLGNIDGILIVSGSSFNTIGSLNLADRNLISGNGDGIELFGAISNTIQGNLIGTTASGSSALGNTIGLLLTSSGTKNNTIGGTVTGAGNVIAFNSGTGIQAGNGNGNSIRGNSIHSNNGVPGVGGFQLGIDLIDNVLNGTSQNDALDADIGANNLQNFPDLTSATVSGDNTTVQGRLNSTPSTTFNIDFYSNPTCDTDSFGNTMGYGEGQTYIGSTVVTTGSRGTIAFSATLPVNTTGQTITATATDSANNTSEFSGCLAVGALQKIAVTTTADNGDNTTPTPGSLRAAIRKSNSLGGLKAITFNIPASDPNCDATTNVCSIVMPTALQDIITPVVIDGWSQGGTGYTGRPLIQLNKVLTIHAGSSTVQGLIINRGVDGITLLTFGGNLIRGNYIGTDLSGLNPINTNFGITSGIFIRTPENVIGGTTPAARNLISGANSNGIVLHTTLAAGNIIQGNYIGTDVNGTNVIGNRNIGILITSSASNNVIGGTVSGAGNLIAFSLDGSGISVASGTGNLIRGNSISNNNGLGIDLGSIGITPNDSGDGDTGANNLQNFPVLTSANRISGGSTTISGSLNSLSNTQFAIDFYANTACDDSGNGEGATYLGSTTVTTDNSSNASFNQTFSTTSSSQFITATATNTATGDTSEFSACRSIASSGILTISGQITSNGNALPGVTVSLSGSATNSKTTDSAGNFSFADLPAGGNFTVFPMLANHAFTPSSQTFNNLTANKTANFTAVQCSYSINPNGVNAPATSSTGSFTVTAPAGCTWTAVANENWLSVTSGSEGNGNGTVNYSVATNTGAQRTGTITAAGQNFIVTQSGASHSISGAVIYGITPANQAAKFVQDVSISATGANSAFTATDSAGAYLLENLTAGGNYTVKPTKTGNVNGITAFDATLVLRHVAAGGQGANALNQNQQKAADTDGDDIVSAFDATQILRFVAANGANSNTGQTGNWKFLPDQQSYTPLNNSLSGENYTAILIGEVTGDWSETPAPENKEFELKEHPQKGKNFNSELQAMEFQDSQSTNVAEIEGNIILVPIMLTNKTGAQISSFNFDVAFPTAVLQTVNSAVDTNGTLSGNCSIVSDIFTRGRIGIAGACSNGIKTSGILLNLRFKVIGKQNFASDNATLIFRQPPVFQDSNGNFVSVKRVNAKMNAEKIDFPTVQSITGHSENTVILYYSLIDREKWRSAVNKFENFVAWINKGEQEKAADK